MPVVVTAVIPCHNHKQWVWDAINSVARQDYPIANIVVVDDGSTDGSFDEVARQLYKPKMGEVSDYPTKPKCVIGTVPNTGVRLVAVRHEIAGGPSFARNFGINVFAGTTDVFAFLDSDDMYEQGKVRRSVEKILVAPGNIGAVYTDYDTLRPDGLRVREWKEPFARERLVRECIVNCDSIVTKKAIAAVGLFDEDMRVCEDYDFWMRVSEKFLIVHIPESLVTIRVGHHSSTSTVKKELWQQNWRRVMEKAQARQNAQG